MKILSAKDGYDVVAPHYKDTKWQHLWGQVEKPFVSRWLTRLKKGVGIDIGSGVGPYISEIVAQRQRVVALDTSPQMLVQNRDNNKILSDEVSYVVGDIESQLSFNENFFDWAICTRVLSNVAKLDHAINEISRLVKKDGHVLITDIHPEHHYDYTAFEVPLASASMMSQKINIETHKHDIPALIRVLEQNGFAVDTLDTLTTKDIEAHINKDKFEKLYASLDEKILYVLQVTKRANKKA